MGGAGGRVGHVAERGGGEVGRECREGGGCGAVEDVKLWGTSEIVRETWEVLSGFGEAPAGEVTFEPEEAPGKKSRPAGLDAQVSGQIAI